VRRYDARLQIDPEAATIQANVTVDLELAPGEREATLLLNRGLTIDSLQADRPVSGYAFDRERREMLRYAAEATPLTVRLAAPDASGSTLRLALAYHGALEPDSWGVNTVSPDWVELGLYSGWFPLDPEMGNFDSRLRVRLPDEWNAVGTGGLSRKGDTWVAEAEDVGDVTVIAAPALATVDAGGGIRVHAAGGPTNRLDQVAAAAARTRERLTRLLGPAGDGSLDVVLASRSSGGGYVRPGLAVLLDDGGDLAGEKWTRYLGHEISHLWWHLAPATTWEDWLNESFAEESALLLIREELGEAPWRARLERYRTASSDLPPIEGVDRSDQAAYAVLYRKGPVVLSDLEQRIGRQTFGRFLRTVVSRRAATTEAVLADLGEVASPEAASWLEEALRR